jgi:hypothetical protein
MMSSMKNSDDIVAPFSESGNTPNLGKKKGQRELSWAIVGVVIALFFGLCSLSCWLYDHPAIQMLITQIVMHLIK